MTVTNLLLYPGYRLRLRRSIAFSFMATACGSAGVIATHPLRVVADLVHRLAPPNRPPPRGNRER